MKFASCAMLALCGALNSGTAHGQDSSLFAALPGSLELASMVGPSFPLEQVNEAVEASLAGAPGRVLVTP